MNYNIQIFIKSILLWRKREGRNLCFYNSTASTNNKRTRSTVAGVFDSATEEASSQQEDKGRWFFSFFPFSHRLSASLSQRDVVHLRRHYTAWQGASVPALQLLATFSAPYSRAMSSSHAPERVTPMRRQQLRCIMIVAGWHPVYETATFRPSLRVSIGVNRWVAKNQEDPGYSINDATM